LELNHLIQSLPFSNLAAIASLVFCLPILVFLILLFFGHLIKKSDWIATIGMGLNFVLCAYLFSQIWFNNQVIHWRFDWIHLAGSQSITLGLKLDKLSSLLLVSVTFISTLVHLFSQDYMHDDKQYVRYFAYLNVFTTSMLGIVMADNLLLIFVFWELVGLTSYLLIGFWYQKDTAIRASKKAFLLNKIGDIGFLAGLMIIWTMCGTFDLEALYQLYTTSHIIDGNWVLTYTVSGLVVVKSIPMIWLTVLGLGIFAACVGKSAQFPLQIWLPDAMEGPTPVSALIHAATMVAAGVYLLARVFPLLDYHVLIVVAITGAISALMGAYAATSQYDIKKILAYSTISQLGYMVMAMGVGAFKASLFHLFTHAFFKAGLFLSVGAVIHAMHHLQHTLEHKGLDLHFDPQNVHLMGGLRKALPFTFVIYCVTAWAAMGLPLSTGFVSKDAILAGTLAWADAMSNQGYVWAYIIPFIAFFTAFFTAFYMGRQLFVVFFGEFKLPKVYTNAKDAFKYIHDIEWKMKIPLLLLACMSIFIIFTPNPFDGEAGWLYQGISSVPSAVPNVLINSTELSELTHHYHWIALGLSLLVAGAGVGAAYLKYGRNVANNQIASNYQSNPGLMKRLSINNFYLDYLYKNYATSLIIKVADSIAQFDNKVIDKAINGIGVFYVIVSHIVAWKDKYIVDGFVNTVVFSVSKIGTSSAKIQGGKVQLYFAWMLIGVMGLLIWFVW
jgi:NADH-quinone oxidoreductase subunit L